MWSDLKWIILVIVLIFSGCAKKEKDDAGMFPRVLALEGTLLSEQTLIVKNPRGPFIIDSCLFVVSPSLDRGMIKGFSFSNLAEEASYGIKGKGPYDFMWPEILDWNESDKTFRIFDASRYFIASFQVVRSEGGVNIEETGRRRVGQSPEMRPRSLTTFSDRFYAGIGFVSDSSFFALLDSNLNFLEYFGNVPVSGVNDLFSSFQGYLKGSGDLLFYSCGDLPYLACYRLIKGVPEKSWDLWYDDSFHGVVNGSLLYNKDKSIGYCRGLFVSKNYIFLLFLDIKKSEYNARDSNFSFANLVYVFDLEGKRIASMRLNHRVARIYISEDEKKLFGVTVVPDYSIASFDLPPL